MKRGKWFERLVIATRSTRERLFKKCSSIWGGSSLDERIIEEFEEALISCDMGVAATQRIISKIRSLGKENALLPVIKGEISSILGKCRDYGLNMAAIPPTVIMVIGVNGVGKTTTIAKLAYRFKQEGQGVILICGDTFRAAAAEQLQAWADRLGVQIISQAQGADSAAVVFDGLCAAKARKNTIAIIDTAGRLHTKVNLINELKKIKQISAKQVIGSPHEILLVLDATVGQNGMVQAELFAREVGVTGIVLTKLDGTAKGGIIVEIADRLNIPVKFVGIGEGLEDLLEFSGEEFVEALFTNGKLG